MQMFRLFIAVLFAFCSACAEEGQAGKSPPSFEAGASKWSPVNALALAEAADLAYEKDAEEKVKKRLNCTEFAKLTFKFAEALKTLKFEEGEPGPQGFIAGGEDQIVIAFRGTEWNLADLLTDGFAGPDTLPAYDNGKVHQGFNATCDFLWKDLRENLDKMRKAHPKAKIWITGHSLGGGLAVMAAARLLEEKQPVQGVITFGAPVTGDAAFQKALSGALDGRIWRCVHDLDAVTFDFSAAAAALASLAPFWDRLPSVPSLAVVKQLTHGGEAIYLSRTGTVDSDGQKAMSGAVKEYLGSVIRNRKWSPPADVLSRHSIGGGYIPALRLLVKAQSGATPPPPR